jgi:hypothetical protein
LNGKCENGYRQFINTTNRKLTKYCCPLHS